MFTYEFEYEDLDYGKKYQVEVDLEVTFESSYGQDADGRRGVAMHFVELSKIRIYDDATPNGRVLDEDSNHILYDNVEKYYNDYKKQQAIDEAVEEFDDYEVEE